jgi:hypothetical protein
VRYFRRDHTLIRWEEQQWITRLLADEKLIRVPYPTLSFVIDQPNRKATLAGDIVLVAECGIPTCVAVEIRFPRDYPKTEPDGYDAERRFKALPGKRLVDRHIFSDGGMCLWLPPRSPWNPTDPNALLHFLDQLSVFVDRQLTYDVTKTWPGPEFDHGPDGYRQYIIEELGNDPNLFALLRPTLAGKSSTDAYDPCPCGLKAKFRFCHQTVVRRIEAQAGVENVRSACAMPEPN